MSKLVVLYPPPLDEAEFEKRYSEEHVPLCQDKLSGMRLAVSHIKGSAAGAAPFFLMAEVWAPSIEALQAFLSSPDGQQVASHAFEISTGGAPVVLFSDEEIHEF